MVAGDQTGPVVAGAAFDRVGGVVAVTEPNLWANILPGRHPATRHLALMLCTNPNLPERMRSVARRCEELGAAMVAVLPDGPELTVALRKLLEAKDAFVRSLL